MLTTFFATLEQMSRILFLLSIGFVFNKLQILPKNTGSILSRLITTLFLPSLMLYTNIMECQLSSVPSYLGLVLIGVVVCVAGILLSYPLGLLFGGKDTYARGVYRYAFAFPNTGAVATPLVLAFSGTAGLFQYNLFCFSRLVLTYTWGIAQMQPTQEKPSLWKTVKKCINPTTVSIVGGLALGLLGAKNWIPSIILTAIGELGDGYVIVGLLLTGYSIADYPMQEVFGNRKVYGYTLIRLIGMPALFLVAMILCGASPSLCLMTVLTMASPCGMNAVIFPAAYGEDCKTGAGMVLISTLCSVLTVPVIYSLVQVITA